MILKQLTWAKTLDDLRSPNQQDVINRILEINHDPESNRILPGMSNRDFLERISMDNVERSERENGATRAASRKFVIRHLDEFRGMSPDRVWGRFEEYLGQVFAEDRQAILKALTGALSELNETLTAEFVGNFLPHLKPTEPEPGPEVKKKSAPSPRRKTAGKSRGGKRSTAARKTSRKKPAGKRK